MAFVDDRTLTFMGRLGSSIAVLGSVFALVAVSTSAVYNVLAQKEMEEADKPLRIQMSKTDLITPVQQRIQAHEGLMARLKDPVARREEERHLASLYDELGKRDLTFKQLTNAESAFQRSLELDPDNPQYLSDLANLYANAAVRQAEADQKLNFYRSSTVCWESAATNAPDPNQRRTYQEGAAQVRIKAASLLTAQGLSYEARMELEKARSLAPQLAAEIDTLLRGVRS